MVAKLPSHCPFCWLLLASPARAVIGAGATRLGRTRPVGIGGEMRSAGGLGATVLNADVAIRSAFSSSPAGAGFA